MTNSLLHNIVKRGKKGSAGKLKFATGLPTHITNNITIHDIFTLLLILAAIILLLVL